MKKYKHGKLLGCLLAALGLLAVDNHLVAAQPVGAGGAAAAAFEPLIPPAAADGYVHLEWDSLMPLSYSGEELGQAAGDDDGLGIVEELLGMKVSIPGFMVPLDVDGTAVNAFLLVPYHGACIHVPAPPPNQLIYAELDVAYELDEMWVPLEIFGTLQAEYLETEAGAAGYRLEVDDIQLFKY